MQQPCHLERSGQYRLRHGQKRPPEALVTPQERDACGVAEKLLVAALAYQNHRNSGARGQLTDVIERHAYGIGKGLVLLMDQTRKVLFHLADANFNFMMIGAEAL